MKTMPCQRVCGSDLEGFFHFFTPVRTLEPCPRCKVSSSVKEDEVSVPAGTPTNDDIARLAHAIWEAEGQPESRDHEHWMRARRLIEEGRADGGCSPGRGGQRRGLPRPPPGAARLRGRRSRHRAGDERLTRAARVCGRNSGGRFAQQLAELPDQPAEERAERPDIPGPRNPDPEPATNAEGYVAVPSSENVAALGLKTIKPQPRAPDAQSKRGRAKAPAPL